MNDKIREMFRTFSKVCAWLLVSIAVPAIAEETHSGVCFLSYRVPRGEVRCSSVLLAPKIVVTSSHCFPAERKLPDPSAVSVQCGIQSQGKSGGNFSFTEQFHAATIDAKSMNQGEVARDYAFLTLDRAAVKVQSMDLPSSPDDFRESFMMQSPLNPNEYIFNPNIECRSSGFGRDKTTRDSYFRTSDQSPGSGLNGYIGITPDTQGIVVINAWGRGVDSFRHGDSGGAFYCRKSSSSAWKLVGIISMGNGRALGLLTATSSRPFLTKFRQIAFVPDGTSESAGETTITRTGQKIFIGGK